MRPLLIILCLMIHAVCASQAAAQTTRPGADVEQLLVALQKQMDAGAADPSPGSLPADAVRRLKPEEFQSLLEALAALPPTDDRRLRALDLAGRYARAADLSARARGHGNHRSDHVRLRFAWTILQTLGVIRDGAKAEDLAALLGAPNRKHREDDGTERWSWYYDSPMHVNPTLHVRFKDGRATRTDVGRG